MSKIKEFPFHTFLFSVYVVLFIYTQNISQVTLSMTYRTLIVSFIFTVLVYSLTYLVYKNKEKTGVFCTLFLLIVFSYGAVYNKVEVLYYRGLFPFSNIHRYLFLIFGVSYIVLFYWILKSKRTFFKFNYFLNVFVLVIIFINIISIFRYNFSKHSIGKEFQNPFLENVKNTIVINDVKAKTGTDLPDIYYIILDGYGRNDILKKYYNFDNSGFSNFLKSKGFYIADSSQTNYPYTSKSLASSLNLNYVDKELVDTLISDQELISQNYLSYYLKQKGYKIICSESGYAITKFFDFADVTIKHGGLNEFERSIMELTILRLDDLLGISTYTTLKGVIKGLDQIEAQPSPKFSFIHIVAPHPPYVFNKNGSFNTKKSFGHAFWEPRNDYIAQLEYINSVIEKFITGIIKNTKIQPIIVLQSDHGPWIADISEDNVYSARCEILNAYLVPQKCKINSYPTISPVNSFRIVLNELFDLKLKILLDVAPNEMELKSNYKFQKILRVEQK